MGTPKISASAFLTADERSELDQLQGLLGPEGQRRIQVMGPEAHRYLLQWTSEATREAVLETLDVVEDLMEAVRQGNDVM